MQHNPSICEAIKEEIDGLSQKGFEKARISGLIYDHVQGCASCLEYFQEALEFAAVLDQWEAPVPKENVCARVMTEIAQIERNHRVHLPDLLRQGLDLLSARVRVPAFAALSVILALVISITLNIAGSHRAAITPTAIESAGMQTQATGASSQTGYVYTADPAQIRSILGRASLAPSTFVVILGAPPDFSQDGLWASPSVVGSSAGITKPSTQGNTSREGTGSKTTNNQDINL
jgi:hypothetical protein